MRNFVDSNRSHILPFEPMCILPSVWQCCWLWVGQNLCFFKCCILNSSIKLNTASFVDFIFGLNLIMWSWKTIHMEGALANKLMEYNIWDWSYCRMGSIWVSVFDLAPNSWRELRNSHKIWLRKESELNNLKSKQKGKRSIIISANNFLFF